MTIPPPAAALAPILAESQALAKESAALAHLRGYGPCLVAFSAGVDSTYLLDLAVEALGKNRVVAVTADSPSLARHSLEEARVFCHERGIEHLVVATDEFDSPDYLANDGQRCYHCKSALLKAMNALALALINQGRLAHGAKFLIGAIADDLGDYRPGMRAAAEAGALWPLADAGFSKAEVRERSRARNLPTWNRPAEPCLSSRLPYGEPVTVEALAMIEGAERVLRTFGFPTCRARHHRIGAAAGPNGNSPTRGNLLRIEVPIDDLARVVASREILLPALRACGYANVTLDLAGFVSGGYNALLAPARQQPQQQQQ